MPSKDNRHKDETKYTFWRTKEDIKNLEKLRDYLKRGPFGHFKLFNTDSGIYRHIPGLFFRLMKVNEDLEKQVDELKEKLEDFAHLKESISDILKIIHKK